MIAEIIAAGSEMLTPFRQDTNSLFLTAELNALGVAVAFKTIVGDSLAHLTGAAKIAFHRADIVIFSGGLGPTEDDLTREAVAAALGIELRKDAAILASLAQRFAARGIPMAPNNGKQADTLEGARVLNNRNGSAPGQILDTKFGGQRRIVILLPGPPRELKALFTDACVPFLSATLPPSFFAKRLLRMALIPESEVDARTAPIYCQYPDVDTTILAGSAEIQLHFLCAKPAQEQAESRVAELSSRVREEMGESIFSKEGESLEEVVLSLLRRHQMTLTAAESCTGGLLSQRLTAVPNASVAFMGGAVVYTMELKTLFAGVAQETVHTYGSVSPEVARALAEGMRVRTGASLGVSITGLAGPDGGATGPDERRPIGLVYIGLADAHGTEIKEVNLQGDRERVRLWASQHALELVRRYLLRLST